MVKSGRAIIAAVEDHPVHSATWDTNTKVARYHCAKSLQWRTCRYPNGGAVWILATLSASKIYRPTSSQSIKS